MREKLTLEAVTLVMDRDGLAAVVVGPLVLVALFLKGWTLPKNVLGTTGNERGPETKVWVVGTAAAMMSG